MRHVYFKLLLCWFGLSLAVPVLSQNKKAVLYDDWPVTVRANADRKQKKDGDVSTNFVPVGAQWNERILTYFFQNGTNDINNDDERQPVRQALNFWADQTDIVFLEVCNANDADIVILWAEGDHGDGMGWSGLAGQYYPLV